MIPVIIYKNARAATNSLLKLVWKRWMQELLSCLNAHHKWFKACRGFRPGDIAMVFSTDIAHGKWQLRRILVICSGKDGHVRVTKVQINENEIVKHISKLCWGGTACLC